MKLNKAYSCAELSAILDASCDNDSHKTFDIVSSLSNPLNDSLGFIFEDKINEDISSFSGLIVSNTFEQDVGEKVILFKVDNVKHSLSMLLNTIPNLSSYTMSKEYSNVTIGENVEIGSNCIIYSGVFINHNTIIGDNVIIHPNAVVGSDGFGLYQINGLWKKIPHLGSVIIESNVEIGSNTTIDRGMMDNTILKNNCKIDNLVHIAHNVTIGSNTAIAACTGIAGSTTIGDNCTIGGGVGINGHITICDNVNIHGMSMITKSITKEGDYASALAADSVRNWRRNQVIFRNLHKKNR
ncbi:UDP-3-O-(3-hydroxymyristoyl)glucosamine N-acyltransferase [Gammaproteobacteria bacterium]|nr:UDP-3-O-(3-hydroxymyristoyl)glucosamine N-acyltransferase [Gammaproteobacteria bacterium]